METEHANRYNATVDAAGIEARREAVRERGKTQSR